MLSFVRALDRNVPDALLVSVPAGFPYFPKEEEPPISGRIEPSKQARGSNFAKELPVQELKTKIQPECKAILLGLIAASLVLPLVATHASPPTHLFH
jgi:hypothetical protein